MQERGWLGSGYITRTGFLPLAADNDVVIMFPQIKHSLLQGNPNGCWDWWGYNGDILNFKYATKHGKQMTGVAHMIERVAGINMY